MYRATVLEVVDGDTVGLRIDLGFSVHVGEEGDPVVFRLDGVNCPESSGPDASPEGEAAKAFTGNLLPVGAEVLVRTRKVKSTKGPIRDRKEKFGRYLAQVLVPPRRGLSTRPKDGDTLLDLAQALLVAGYAKVYTGGKR